MAALPYIIAFFLAPTIATAVLVLFTPLPADNLAVRTLRGVVFGLTAVGVSWVIFRLLRQPFGVRLVLMLLMACFLNDYRRAVRVDEPLRSRPEVEDGAPQAAIPRRNVDIAIRRAPGFDFAVGRSVRDHAESASV